MNNNIDGFYAAYITGADASGLFVLALKDGKFAGADTSGGVIDGSYSKLENKSAYSVTAKLHFEEAGRLVQGVDIPEGFSYELSFNLPENFTHEDYIRIETPLGAVNSKFKKIRSLN